MTCRLDAVAVPRHDTVRIREVPAIASPATSTGRRPRSTHAHAATAAATDCHSWRRQGEQPIDDRHAAQVVGGVGRAVTLLEVQAAVGANAGARKRGRPGVSLPMWRRWCGRRPVASRTRRAGTSVLVDPHSGRETGRLDQGEGIGADETCRPGACRVLLEPLSPARVRQHADLEHVLERENAPRPPRTIRRSTGHPAPPSWPRARGAGECGSPPFLPRWRMPYAPRAASSPNPPISSTTAWLSRSHTHATSATTNAPSTDEWSERQPRGLAPRPRAPAGISPATQTAPSAPTWSPGSPTRTPARRRPPRPARPGHPCGAAADATTAASVAQQTTAARTATAAKLPGSPPITLNRANIPAGEAPSTARR